jgi:hypothetical protein
MSIRRGEGKGDISAVKRRPAPISDKLTTICEPIVWTMWDPQHLRTVSASTVCYRDSFTFTFIEKVGLYTASVGVVIIVVATTGLNTASNRRL